MATVPPETDNTIEMKSVLIRIRAVEKITGLYKSTIYRYIKASRFPKGIKIGTQSTAWVESEVFEWNRHAIAAARNAESPVA